MMEIFVVIIMKPILDIAFFIFCLKLALMSKIIFYTLSDVCKAQKLAETNVFWGVQTFPRTDCISSLDTSLVSNMQPCVNKLH